MGPCSRRQTQGYHRSWYGERRTHDMGCGQDHRKRRVRVRTTQLRSRLTYTFNRPTSALISRNACHTGAVRALGFNLIQGNLLASGASNGEILIWDMNNPTKSYNPGPRSAKLEDVTALAWNAIVPSILGTSSSSGFTSVWDLRSKKEVVALTYGGGGSTAGGPMGGALAQGGRRGMSDVAWHPDNVWYILPDDERV